MHFDEYSERANKSDGNNIVSSENTYYLLGLAGETGEVLEKYKKIFRNKGGVFSEEDKRAIASELGDCIWYITMLGKRIGYSLEDIARINNEKTLGRLERGNIKSEGDNR